jgi:uncharacterized protein (DUF1778 family)
LIAVQFPQLAVAVFGMARAAAKRERLEARVTADQKSLLQLAANIQGRSLTDFIISSAQAAAEETIRTRQIVLSARDSALFVETLLNPPEPNANLRRAMQRAHSLLCEE